jgi:serine/threonine-protein kinase
LSGSSGTKQAGNQESVFMNLIACTSCGQENPSEAHFCSRCGNSLPKPNANQTESGLTPGTWLRDRYIIQHPLGQGGFSRTYLAEDTGRFNEQVTLKELTPTNQGTYALQKAEELFQREAAMLHKLQHPQIPRFWEFFRDGKRLFLVQDYIEGKTYQSLLEERMASGQTFSEAEIIELFEQLLPILSYLHSLGVIHRDISPDNIICRAPDRVPVLIDLGGVTKVSLEVATPVASSQNSTASSSATRLGKIGYAPDEQLRLGIAAPHSDLYALGVTALVLMTGKQPQQLIDLETMEWNWQEHLSLSPFLAGIINRMLATQPVERFQSANELLQQLETRSTVAPTQLHHRFTQNDASARNSSPTSANNSGQGHLFDDSVKVPREIQGWNWGAFFLPGVWCITNQVWIGLISWTDFSLITLPLTLGMTWPIMAVILGIKGNEWAWKSRRWNSVKDFKRHQRLWAFVGFLLIAALLLLVALIVFMIVALGMSSMGTGNMGGMGGTRD